MNNLLIVDDEIEILEWLKELFQYECPRELDVYGAESALEAVKYLDEIHFDVVLTDIKMPGMDGIELFHKIKENWPSCKVIFLTGYEEFDYLYEIIKHKDVRYILKREEDSVIMENVLAAFGEIDEMLRAEQDHESEVRYVEQARAWLQREYYTKLLQGGREAGTEEELEKIGIRLKPSFPVLMFLCRIDSSPGRETVADDMEPFYKVFEKMEYYLPGHIHMETHIIDYHYGLLFFQPVRQSEKTDWERLRKICMGAVDYVQQHCENLEKLHTFFVAGNRPCGLQEIGERYECLKRLAVNRRSEGISVLLREENQPLENSLEHNYSEISMRVKELEKSLEIRNQERFYQELKVLTDMLVEEESRHSNYALEIYYSISMVFLRFINENSLSVKIAFKIGAYKLTRADEHKDWKEAAKYFFELAAAVFGLLNKEEEESNEKTLHKVQEYIAGHLEDDLTLNRLAEIGCFNASYLSRLFKQVYGCNISEYVMNMRMERAKELLISTTDKINEISVKVGYLSAHSFTRTFKNAVGISPLEYRELYRR